MTIVARLKRCPMKKTRLPHLASANRGNDEQLDVNHDVFSPPVRKHVPGKPDRDRAERQKLPYVATGLRQDFHNGMFGGRPPRPGGTLEVSNWATCSTFIYTLPSAAIQPRANLKARNWSYYRPESCPFSRVVLRAWRKPFVPSRQSGVRCSVIAGCSASSLVFPTSTFSRCRSLTWQ